MLKVILKVILVRSPPVGGGALWLLIEGIGAVEGLKVIPSTTPIPSIKSHNGPPPRLPVSTTVTGS